MNSIFYASRDSLYGPISEQCILRSNWYIQSENKEFFLLMQPDGNLVGYDKKWRAFWSSGTYGRGICFCILQTDGNCVIYTVDGHIPVWATNTVFPLNVGTYSLTLQNDRDIVMYRILNGQKKLIWRSNTKIRYILQDIHGSKEEQEAELIRKSDQIAHDSSHIQ